MTKFIFKSNASDLQKISQSIETIQKNVLYLTYRTDSMLKILKEMTIDKGLQRQVDEYFEETSPQTEQEEQDGSSNDNPTGS